MYAILNKVKHLDILAPQDSIPTKLVSHFLWSLSLDNWELIFHLPQVSKPTLPYDTFLVSVGMCTEDEKLINYCL